MKPHIFRANGGWTCLGRRYGYCGATPFEAFSKWARVEITWYSDRKVTK